LPEDDIPHKILGVVQRSDDVGVIDQESGGYVPREDEGVGMDIDIGGKPFFLPGNSENVIEMKFTKMKRKDRMSFLYKFQAVWMWDRTLPQMTSCCGHYPICGSRERKGVILFGTVVDLLVILAFGKAGLLRMV
jgi:hypothetical protein